MDVSGLFPEFRCEGWLRQRHPTKNPPHDHRGPPGVATARGAKLHFSEASHVRGEALPLTRGCTSHSSTLSWDLIM